MTTQKAHVDVAERRLRPVYDALDNLNNKQAIKLVDSILKKQKDLLCAKALKSLALIRAGRNSEGVALLDEIKNSKIKLDDSTLQAMTMCYKETNMPNGIVSIYEVAVQQTPKNEEFLSHFFMSCVRVEDYTKQHKAAMNLYKAYPKNPYYFWTVMSNFMQALSTKDEKKKNMFLTLAERMVSKFIKEDKIDAEEEVRLYMLILENLGRYEEALKLVQSEFGDKLKCVISERAEKEIEYLAKLERWVEVNIKYKEILKKNPDQWLFYMGYFDSIEKLQNVEYAPDVPVDTENIQPDITREAVLTTLQNLRDENQIIRGPFLAMMEFQKRIGKGDEASPELIDLLHQYYKQFGHKPCCFNDIKRYAHLLSIDQRKQFIEYLSSTYKVENMSDENVPQKERVNNLMREICIECLCRKLDNYSDLNQEEKFLKAKTYMKRFNDTLQLAMNLNSTEPQYGDNLVLLAAYLLLDINKEKGDNSMLWHVLLILEEAVETSPTFFQFKILLMFLYTKLGAYGACDELMLEIEVKYIMYDSLGYLLTYGGYTSGQFQATLRLHDASIGFYTACAKDTPEQIIAAYKYGSFPQIPEMTRFQHRVKTSYQYSYIVLESLYLDLMRFANSAKETRERFDKVQSMLGSLDIQDIITLDSYDNRDFTVMDNFECESQYLTDEQKLHSHKQNSAWIRLRFSILHTMQQCLSEIVECNGSCENESVFNLNDSLTKIEEAITDATNCISNESDIWTNIQNPPPSYLHPYLKANHAKVIVQLLSACASVSNSELEDMCAITVNQCLVDAHTIMRANLNDVLSNLTKTHGGNTMFNGNCLSLVTFYTETCNLVAILLYLVCEFVKKKLADIRRNKKKKAAQNSASTKQELIFASIKDMSTSFMTDMTLLHDQLMEVKKNYVDQTLDTSVLEDLFEKTNSTTVTRIWQKIQASYQLSIFELTQIISFKIIFFKFLTTL